jgi:hypothetical protein
MQQGISEKDPGRVAALDHFPVDDTQIGAVSVADQSGGLWIWAAHGSAAFRDQMRSLSLPRSAARLLWMHASARPTYRELRMIERSK